MVVDKRLFIAGERCITEHQASTACFQQAARDQAFNEERIRRRLPASRAALSNRAVDRTGVAWVQRYGRADRRFCAPFARRGTCAGRSPESIGHSSKHRGAPAEFYSHSGMKSPAAYVAWKRAAPAGGNFGQSHLKR